MDCNLMLQSAFNWAKKGKLSNGEFPTYATVFATVTLHYSIDRPEKTSDLVLYANGPLHLKSTTPGQEILTGNIQAWVNNVAQIPLPPKPGDVFGNVIYDLFPNTPNNQLLVSVSKTGFITVGKLINGTPGSPTGTFQATCENELLTGRVNVAGQAVCTVSFSLGSSNMP
jgi:hypothetical protein